MCTALMYNDFRCKRFASTVLQNYNIEPPITCPVCTARNGSPTITSTACTYVHTVTIIKWLLKIGLDSIGSLKPPSCSSAVNISFEY